MQTLRTQLRSNLKNWVAENSKDPNEKADTLGDFPDDAKFKRHFNGRNDYNGLAQKVDDAGSLDDAKYKNQFGGREDYNGGVPPPKKSPVALSQRKDNQPGNLDDAKFKNQFGGREDYNGGVAPPKNPGSLTQKKDNQEGNLDDAKYKN